MEDLIDTEMAEGNVDLEEALEAVEYNETPATNVSARLKAEKNDSMEKVPVETEKTKYELFLESYLAKKKEEADKRLAALTATGEDEYRKISQEREELINTSKQSQIAEPVKDQEDENITSSDPKFWNKVLELVQKDENYSRSDNQRILSVLKSLTT
eukprot:snap_masked-scaffold_14-processed-gene-8.13-mRNA-1 protein AED:1.00 eAED:1.00 QI:0/-1/0/0/-1/1/1/0/156